MRAFRWQALIDSGTYRNTIELAEAIGKDPAFVARMIQLTLLTPEIVHAILAGTLRESIPMEKLRKEMPIRWEDQKKLFGIKLRSISNITIGCRTQDLECGPPIEVKDEFRMADLIS